MGQISVKNKNVLVTGGAGVIGRELLAQLIHEGANVLSVDRHPLPDGNWDGVIHIKKDLTTDSLKEIGDFQPDMVFHLAAAFERSEESPDFWAINWRDNVVLSHRLVDLVKEMHGLETFVFASSYLVYSPSLYLSTSLRDKAVYLQEDDPVSPRNLCGAAKYYGEQEIGFVKKTLNPSLRAIHARIFRVYGRGSRDVISRWVQAALSRREIEVYNKQNRFDFIFSGDVAEGLLRLAESPDAGGPVNLGSGAARSIQDILHILSENTPMVDSMSQDLGTSERFEASCADLTKLRKLTSWTPPTRLEKGIKTLFDFERKRPAREITYGQ